MGMTSKITSPIGRKKFTFESPTGTPQPFGFGAPSLQDDGMGGEGLPSQQGYGTTTNPQNAGPGSRYARMKMAASLAAGKRKERAGTLPAALGTPKNTVMDNTFSYGGGAGYAPAARDTQNRMGGSIQQQQGVAEQNFAANAAIASRAKGQRTLMGQQKTGMDTPGMKPMSTIRGMAQGGTMQRNQGTKQAIVGEGGEPELLTVDKNKVDVSPLSQVIANKQKTTPGSSFTMTGPGGKTIAQHTTPGKTRYDVGKGFEDWLAATMRDMGMAQKSLDERKANEQNALGIMGGNQSMIDATRSRGTESRDFMTGFIGQGMEGLAGKTDELRGQADAVGQAGSAARASAERSQMGIDQTAERLMGQGEGGLTEARGMRDDLSQRAEELRAEGLAAHTDTAAAKASMIAQGVRQRTDSQMQMELEESGAAPGSPQARAITSRWNHVGQQQMYGATVQAGTEYNDMHAQLHAAFADDVLGAMTSGMNAVTQARQIAVQATAQAGQLKVAGAEVSLKAHQMNVAAQQAKGQLYQAATQLDTAAFQIAGQLHTANEASFRAMDLALTQSEMANSTHIADMTRNLNTSFIQMAPVVANIISAYHQENARLDAEEAQAGETMAVGTNNNASKRQPSSRRSSSQGSGSSGSGRTGRQPASRQPASPRGTPAPVSSPSGQNAAGAPSNYEPSFPYQ